MITGLQSRTQDMLNLNIWNFCFKRKRLLTRSWIWPKQQRISYSAIQQRWQFALELLLQYLIYNCVAANWHGKTLSFVLLLSSISVSIEVFKIKCSDWRIKLSQHLDKSSSSLLSFNNWSQFYSLFNSFTAFLHWCILDVSGYQWYDQE